MMITAYSILYDDLTSNDDIIASNSESIFRLASEYANVGECDTSYC